MFTILFSSQLLIEVPVAKKSKEDEQISAGLS